MDYIPKDIFLQINPNTLEEVRRNVNLHRPGEMKEAVRILHEWIQQQPHFKKKDFPLHYLEMIIISSKGSLERAKNVIDSMCTTRTLMPRFFEPVAPKKENLEIWETNSFLVLPKLTPNNSRVIMAKFTGKYNKTKSISDLYSVAYKMFEYLFLHDYSSKTIIIYDLTELDLLDTFMNINLFDLKIFYQVLLDCYSMRLEKFHIITESKIVDKFISFFTPFMKKKIMERVEVNKSFEELYKYIPKEMFPKDYGGDEKSMAEVYDKCIEILSSDEHLEHLKRMMDAQVDESQRSRAEFNELYAGTVGTFRTLTVD